MATTCTAHRAAIRATLAFTAGWSATAATLSYRLGAILRDVRAGTLPHAFDTAAYGIAWAVETGRLPGAVELRLRALSYIQTAALVIDCAGACPTIGDVPAWLITRYA